MILYSLQITVATLMISSEFHAKIILDCKTKVIGIGGDLPFDKYMHVL